MIPHACALTFICGPTLIHYTKKLIKSIDWTSRYEVQYDLNIQFQDKNENSTLNETSAIIDYILKNHSNKVHDVILKSNYNYIEATITEKYKNITIKIVATHQSILVICSSKNHNVQELISVYKQWIHDKIKSYECKNHDYIIINKEFVNVDVFLEKYVYKVAPHFKGLNVLIECSRIGNDIALLHRLNQYGIIYDHPSSDSTTYMYGRIRFVETFEDINIYIEAVNKSIWLYYLPTHTNSNAITITQTRKIVIDRILEHMAFATDIYMYNANDIDEKKNYKQMMLINSDITLFLQDTPLEQYHAIMQRINKINKIKSLQNNGFGVWLYGGPGTGKSTFAKYLAYNTRRDIYLVTLSRIETIDELFEIIYTLASKKSIILFEDIDRVWNTKIINTNDKFDSDAIDKKIGLDAFLSVIDMAIATGIIVIITSNTSVMDDALLRDGRFDFKILMENCDQKQLNQIIEYFGMNTNDPKLLEYMNAFKIKTMSVATVYMNILNMYLN